MISARAALTGMLRAATVAGVAGLLAPPAGAGTWVVHDAGEVLSSFTEQREGRLDFVDPFGGRWELITDIDNADIANRGSGAFHPASAADVREVLDHVEAQGFRLDGLQVFILPFPRRGLVSSSATGEAVYLTPGVYPYLTEQVHALTAHETGHVVQRRRLPDGDRAGWKRYRELRGIEDLAVYHDRARHADRPHEIFAEDFRILFGDAPARYNGSVENRDLVHPDRVSGLREFFMELTGPPLKPPRALLSVFPNPVRAGTSVRLRLPAGHPVPAGGDPAADGLSLEIVGASGRHVRRLNGPPAGGDGVMTWDGTDDAGRRAAPGVYFVRLPSHGIDSAVKLVIVP